MKFVTVSAVLLASLFLSAYGHQLRGVDASGPPAVDPISNGLQTGTAEAKISTLKVKAALVANSAQAAAAQADAAKLKVEELYVKTKAVMPELNAIKKVARKQAAYATANSQESVNLFRQMDREAKTIVENSKQLAVVDVQKMLKAKYNELSEWREKVLTNPWQKAQVASTKAAQPYFKMMGSMAGSMNAYGLEASTMRSQAAADKANAQSLAAGVEAKKAGGDPIGAAQDAEMAKAMEIQSGQLAARAGELESNIGNMRNALPEYSVAAHMAAWNANYGANPDGLPPPPVDPNFAYTPPPREQ